MPPTMDNAQPRAEHKTHRTRLQRTPAYFHTCSGGGYRVLSGGAVEIIIFALQMHLCSKTYGCHIFRIVNAYILCSRIANPTERKKTHT